MLKYADIVKHAKSVKMQLIPAETIEGASDPYRGRFKTFETLLNYYKNNPETGLSPQDSAARALAYQLAFKMDRIGNGSPMPNMRGEGDFITMVPKASHGFPLLKHMNQYARDFRQAYEDNVFDGAPRAMYFGAKGKPLMLQNLDTGDILFHGKNTKYREGMSSEEQAKLADSLYKKVALLMAMRGSQRQRKSR